MVSLCMRFHNLVHDFLLLSIKNYAGPLSSLLCAKLKSRKITPISELGGIELSTIRLHIPIPIHQTETSKIFRLFLSLLSGSLKRSYRFQNQKSLSGLPACNPEPKWFFALYRVDNRSPFQFDQSFERSRLPFEPAQLYSSFLPPGFAGRCCFWPQ